MPDLCPSRIALVFALHQCRFGRGRRTELRVFRLLQHVEHDNFRQFDARLRGAAPALHAALWEWMRAACKTPDVVFQLFVDARGLIGDQDTEFQYAPTSPCGVFLRRALLDFQKSSFEAVAALHDEIVELCQAGGAEAGGGRGVGKDEAHCDVMWMARTDIEEAAERLLAGIAQERAAGNTTNLRGGGSEDERNSLRTAEERLRNFAQHAPDSFRVWWQLFRFYAYVARELEPAIECLRTCHAMLQRHVAANPAADASGGPPTGAAGTGPGASSSSSPFFLFPGEPPLLQNRMPAPAGRAGASAPGLLGDIHYFLLALAGLHYDFGKYEAAAALTEEANKAAQEACDSAGLARCMYQNALVMIQQGEGGKAFATLKRCAERAEALKLKDLHALSWSAISQLLVSRPDLRRGLAATTTLSQTASQAPRAAGIIPGHFNVPALPKLDHSAAETHTTRPSSSSSSSTCPAFISTSGRWSEEAATAVPAPHAHLYHVLANQASFCHPAGGLREHRAEILAAQAAVYDRSGLAPLANMYRRVRERFYSTEGTTSMNECASYGPCASANAGDIIGVGGHDGTCSRGDVAGARPENFLRDAQRRIADGDCNTVVADLLSATELAARKLLPGRAGAYGADRRTTEAGAEQHEPGVVVSSTSAPLFSLSKPHDAVTVTQTSNLADRTRARSERDRAALWVVDIELEQVDPQERETTIRPSPAEKKTKEVPEDPSSFTVVPPQEVCDAQALLADAFLQSGHPVAAAGFCARGLAVAESVSADRSLALSRVASLHFEMRDVEAAARVVDQLVTEKCGLHNLPAELQAYVCALVADIALQRGESRSRDFTGESPTTSRSRFSSSHPFESEGSSENQTPRMRKVIRPDLSVGDVTERRSRQPAGTLRGASAIGSPGSDADEEPLNLSEPERKHEAAFWLRESVRCYRKCGDVDGMKTCCARLALLSDSLGRIEERNLCATAVRQLSTDKAAKEGTRDEPQLTVAAAGALDALLNARLRQNEKQEPELPAGQKIEHDGDPAAPSSSKDSADGMLVDC